MMRILVTGANSYIGLSLKEWLSQWPEKYIVDLISLKTDDWRASDFSQYDVVFHVAALVHCKEQNHMEELYYKVNTVLAVEVANKAKRSGIKQFVFMSTMSVYGLGSDLRKDVEVSRDTLCKPNTLYGKSKLKAEVELDKLTDQDFRLAIIRAPMIYGPNCPGNYARLKKLAMIFPVFPLVNNQRSMLFIDNLSEFIRLLFDNQEEGLFFPQNREYVNTSELVAFIAAEHSKAMYLSNALAYLILAIGNRLNLINKLLGNLKYERNLSAYRDFAYCVADLKKSIKISEHIKKAEAGSNEEGAFYRNSG